MTSVPLSDSSNLTCSECDRVFTRSANLARHVRRVHTQESPHTCDICDKGFATPDMLKRHEKAHGREKQHECSKCKKTFSRKDNLTRHLKTHSRKAAEQLYTCNLCGETFNNIFPFQAHQRDVHQVGGGVKRKASATRNSRPKMVRSIDPSTVEPEVNEGTSTSTSLPSAVPLREAPSFTSDPILPPPDLPSSIHHDHWRAIRTRQSRKNKVQDWYNLRLNSTEPNQLEQLVDTIFYDQTSAFKLNLSFGFILRNNETGTLQYHHSSINNSRVFDSPFLIRNVQDLEQVYTALSNLDVLEWARQQRPNSKWVVLEITNATFYVSKLRDHPIGKSTKLPTYILNNPAVVSLECNGNTGQLYKDNLCFFRCLAVHRGCHPHNLERDTEHYYDRYAEVSNDEFEGISLDDLPDLERLFELNIYVYRLTEVRGEENEETKVVAELVQRSQCRYSNTIYLNLYGKHFSYIKNLPMYTKSYCCSKCDKLWKSAKALNRHERTCEATVRHTFPGGAYKVPPTIFQLLMDEGIEVPEHLQYFPYRATFDFECYFNHHAQHPRNSEKLTWEAEHVPLSVSVCSNVPGFDQPRCFVTNGDTSDLIKRFLEYLVEISEVSYSLLLEQFADIFEQIDDCVPDESDCDDDGETNSKSRPPLGKLKERLDDYLNEFPILGFNSGSYDINVIKKYLFPYLVKHEEVKFVIKRNNNHMCLKTEHLKFLDITNYLAPGFSYDAFIRAYECSQTKGYFPYEWVDSIDKLDVPELPPCEVFYSNLSQSGITDEQYLYCQRVWNQQQMTSFRDFLVWYNNLDVEPFLEAIEKMSLFWKERNIDIFKDGVSVPGLTMKYLFSNVDCYFTLFNDKDKDLYYTMKDNNVGGPSIIFNRYHEKDKTTIRRVEFEAKGKIPKYCKKVVGYDANALYLWAIMQPMPTGNYSRRLADDGFKIRSSTRMAIDWLEWQAHERGVDIRHEYNNTEKRIGSRRLPVDGFCSETHTVFQFHGCWWHGHNCHLNKGKDVNSVRDKPMAELLEETRKNSEYIKAQGFNLVECWECEWRDMQKNNENLQEFIATQLRRPLDQVKTMTKETILASVVDETLFGCVECDIGVPDHLKESFGEMCPIFKNVEISRDDIGNYMKSYAEENKIMPQPRRSLIGSYFGEKILLATPLLKWYLEHGLEVTRIYQVIEYTPNACFQPFGEAVSDARRHGDADPTKAIIADTMKLVGNSSHGKTITNKERHRQVKFCSDDEVSQLINSPFFRQLDAIDEDTYEVQSSKKNIKLDLPLQVGFFVYQYAKLRMLQFYYDFLDKYIDRSDFEFCEMDTDSAYIAISSDNFDSLVKPEKLDEYNEDKHNWFPRTDTVEHTRYDKRTPGLFKVEWEGDGIIGLCSKTYYCFGSKDKFSCKGLNKKHNVINKEKYLDVIVNKQSGRGVNRGFRILGNQMYTYVQEKNALTYFYPKRKVLEDGVTTIPLDI